MNNSNISIDEIESLQRKYVLYPWSVQKNAVPQKAVDAQGVYFTLADGRKILDFSSQIFNASLGHAHPKMIQSIRDAANITCVPHPQGVYAERALLGQNLARISPSAPDKGLVKSFLCLGGAEAVENAIKIARLYTGKHKVITRYRSYHGATLATIGYGGDYRRIPVDNTVNGVVRMPDPYERGSGQKIDTVRLLEEIIEIEGAETIACVLLEGITGANGVFVPPPDYWPRIRTLCTKNNIVLIADEVMSGFGRTGKWFGIDHFGVTPDLMTLGKGITGGYAPLAAVMVNETIAQHFETNMLWCGLTAYGHPLSCAVANAAIAVYEEENLIENSQKRGEELFNHLQNLKETCSLVAEVRSIGLMAAIDLRKSAHDDSPYVSYRASKEENEKAKRLQSDLLNAGLQVVVRFGTIIIAPPLCITKGQLEEGMDKLQRVLKDLK